MATPRKKPSTRKTAAKKTAPARKPDPLQQREDRFAEMVDKYPDDFLACRDMGHAWKPVTAVRQKNGTISRILSCVRCDTSRSQLLDNAGYVIANNYSYKDGYTLPGTGRLTPAHRAVLRLKNVIGD